MKKINGFEIKRKNGEGAGWMAHSVGEAMMMVEFIAKSEKKSINDYDIIPKIYKL